MSTTRRRVYRNRRIAEINVIPYIDVMLVLLVIFMISAPLMNQSVKIELPQADAAPIEPGESRTLLLDIDRDGAYYLYSAGEAPAPLEPEQIAARATAILSVDPQTPVLVRADGGVDYATVIAAMAQLQQAGAAEVGLSTQPLER